MPLSTHRPSRRWCLSFLCRLFQRWCKDDERERQKKHQNSSWPVNTCQHMSRNGFLWKQFCSTRGEEGEAQSLAMQSLSTDALCVEPTQEGPPGPAGEKLALPSSNVSHSKIQNDDMTWHDMTWHVDMLTYSLHIASIASLFLWNHSGGAVQRGLVHPLE